jgi:hypothetical protein
MAHHAPTVEGKPTPDRSGVIIRVMPSPVWNSRVPYWGVLLFVAVLIPTCMGLGYWLAPVTPCQPQPQVTIKRIEYQSCEGCCYD